MNAPHHPLPPLEQVLARFVYDPETGNLTYRFSVGRVAKGQVAGYLTDNGYLVTRIDKIAYHNHRLIWLIMMEEDPEDCAIRHQDGNLTNNRWDNLEVK